jgi:hypothetical protein
VGAGTCQFGRTGSQQADWRALYGAEAEVQDAVLVHVSGGEPEFAVHPFRSAVAGIEIGGSGEDAAPIVQELRMMLLL